MSVVHNLVPNPMPVSTTGWVQFGGCEYRLTDRGIHVTNLGGGTGKGIEYKLLTLPAGDYVYGFRADVPDHGNGDQLSLIKSPTGGDVPARGLLHPSIRILHGIVHVAGAGLQDPVRCAEKTRRRDERERPHPDAGKRMAYGAGVARIRRSALPIFQRSHLHILNDKVWRTA
ncbi:hypothetical protein [Bifidobacterium pseudolongum]|uniref:hypothetical protein n=1 Tax=Bifidobacterium pseudolongum TaxID=1694 RepID=UPI0010213995|nr:hypothetical protein [Bifidobacterium pseudolongum]RYQ73067.1 hypothetical protein PG2012B_1106 [Bifidobacterium pseudolongum subsp. globosum]